MDGMCCAAHFAGLKWNTDRFSVALHSVVSLEAFCYQKKKCFINLNTVIKKDGKKSRLISSEKRVSHGLMIEIMAARERLEFAQAIRDNFMRKTLSFSLVGSDIFCITKREDSPLRCPLPNSFFNVPHRFVFRFCEVQQKRTSWAFCSSSRRRWDAFCAESLTPKKNEKDFCWPWQGRLLLTT